MTEAAGELENLLSEVRKTISDNRQFLEKLMDEAVAIDSDDELKTSVEEEDFEEL